MNGGGATERVWTTLAEANIFDDPGTAGAKTLGEIHSTLSARKKGPYSTNSFMVVTIFSTGTLPLKR